MIFGEDHIPAPMKPVLNGPMGTAERSQTGCLSPPPRKAAESRDSFLPLLAFAPDPARQAKDLSNASPFALENLVHGGAGADTAIFDLLRIFLILTRLAQGWPIFSPWWDF